LQELLELAEENENIRVLPVDVLQHESFGDVAEEVSSIIGGGGLNLLINNAGVSPRSTRINYVSADQMNETFAVNTISPLLLTKAFLPLLKEAANSESDESEEYHINKPFVVNMSSILGSIAENTGDHSGGLYPYRCSKAGLNMVTRSLSNDLKPYGISVISMHPGWVRTDMGGPNATLAQHESVENMINTLRNLEFEHTGLFFNHDGEPIPW